MGAWGVAVNNDKRLDSRVGKSDLSDDEGLSDRIGPVLWVAVVIVSLLALLVIVATNPAHAAPVSTAQFAANAAQKPLENHLLQIAQTAQGTTQAAQTGVREVTWAELQQELASNRGAIVIEFYRNGYPDDPHIADDCDDCANQLPALQKTAQHYAGKVTFLRFDVDRHPQLMGYGLVVFPTHAFVMHSSTDLWVRSIRGFLTEQQFQELIEELFKIKP